MALGHGEGSLDDVGTPVHGTERGRPDSWAATRSSRQETTSLTGSGSANGFSLHVGRRRGPAKTEPEGGVRVAQQLVAGDPQLMRDQFAAHRLDGWVAEQVGEGVDGMCEAVHQVRGVKVDRGKRRPDRPGGYRFPHRMITVVKAAQHAGVEQRTVALAGGARDVRHPRRAGHRVLNVQHRDARLCQRHRQLGVQIRRGSGVIVNNALRSERGSQ